ncbi:DNA polymerase III subunit gamma/tau [Candidatus Saccharibacteria bacterium]|nr:DNA polymerase III subunit gamma/tau [Candidatus Saccharibacteria bacterium]
MGQALYRKYRSKRLGDIVGQEHITDTLSAALKQGRVSHAYLFTGPRGVGKTSIARILAHEINGLAYEHEDNHIDIIEIDAASNRGIDEIRDLREKVYMAPASAKYKVYIIDEVHMLTTPAFNALLKTLEEPPEHVIFILATTEVHKLPETIISRTQRYVFRPVEKSKVVGHLKTIAEQEKIRIDDDALELFAEHGAGSFRDSISLLDQAGNRAEKVTRQIAEAMLGVPPVAALQSIAEGLQSANANELITQLDYLYDQGFRPTAVAKQLGNFLRQSLLAETPQLAYDAQLSLLRSLLDVPAASDPARMLEICLLESLPTRPSNSAVVTEATPTAPETPPPAKKMVTPTPAIKPEVTPPTISKDTETRAAKVKKSDATVPEDVWPQLLDSLKATHNTLYGIMRMAQPEFGSGELSLRFRFAFHQNRMNEAKHRKLIEEKLHELTGEHISISCVQDSEATPLQQPIGAANPDHPEPTAQIPTSSLATVSNIFGGGELLES